MLYEIFYVYWYFIFSILSITFLLVILRRSWGILPRLYVHGLISLQEKFSPVVSKEPPAGQRLKIIQKRHNGRFIDRITANYCHNERNKKETGLLELETELLQAGVEAIIQDDLLFTCDWAPTNYWNILDFPVLNLAKSIDKDVFIQWAMYGAGWIIRFLFLLPVRIGCLILAMSFITVAALFSIVHEYNRTQIIYIGNVFSRLFCQSIGLVAYYENDKHRPRAPGIAVSNHISANDIQMLYADPNVDGYTITGQKHKGLIGWVESTTGRVGSTLWMERSDINERRQFQKIIISYAQDATKEPILLFPEGYCSNGASVSLFRRACFVENVDIYPVAISQDARLGDAFWKEDTFLPYMFRLMTSFAVIYHVKYLPPMRRKKSETAESFARRLQQRIAEANESDALPLDMGVLKKKSEQKKLYDHSQHQCAKILSLKNQI